MRRARPPALRKSEAAGGNSATVYKGFCNGTRLALPAHGVVRGSSPSVRCLPIGLALPAAIPLVAAGYFFGNSSQPSAFSIQLSRLPTAESRLLIADRFLLH